MPVFCRQPLMPCSRAWTCSPMTQSHTREASCYGHTRSRRRRGHRRCRDPARCCMESSNPGPHCSAGCAAARGAWNRCAWNRCVPRPERVALPRYGTAIARECRCKSRRREHGSAHQVGTADNNNIIHSKLGDRTFQPSLVSRWMAWMEQTRGMAKPSHTHRPPRCSSARRTSQPHAHRAARVMTPPAYPRGFWPALQAPTKDDDRAFRKTRPELGGGDRRHSSMKPYTVGDWHTHTVHALHAPGA